MNKYILASSNKHKLLEIEDALPDFELMNLDTLGYHKEIIESGLTLEENALIKARTIFKEYKIACIADDTGLEVDCLDGKPGVYSARYAGVSCIALNNINKLLKALSKSKDRRARFRTVICLKNNQEELLFEGIVEGVISTELKGLNGFGYDPVFIPNGYQLTFAEMSMNQKNKLSHRARAISKLSFHITQ